MLLLLILAIVLLAYYMEDRVAKLTQRIDQLETERELRLNPYTGARDEDGSMWKGS